MTVFRLAVPYQTVAAPNSCALCGWDERGHAQWYFGPHLDPDQPKTYVQPDDRLRLARMKLRRAEQVTWEGADGAQTVTRPNHPDGRPFRSVPIGCTCPLNARTCPAHGAAASRARTVNAPYRTQCPATVTGMCLAMTSGSVQCDEGECVYPQGGQSQGDTGSSSAAPQ